MDTNTAAIAHRVDAARRSKGVGTLPLAKATGIPRTTLTRQLAGQTDFTLAGFLRIGEALDVDPAIWLRDITGAAA